MMNSFIPWVGGKSQLRKQILEMFPKERPSRYIEAFGGAGWMLFSRDSHANLEVFNDLDGHLINLYRCIQYHCNELQRELRLGTELSPLNSRELFLDFKEQLNMRGLTDIQRAARYYYMIRISFGADRHSFGCSKKALATAIDRLPEIQQRLKDVVVENRDFETLLKVYDRSEALFYLDPPYYLAEKMYDGFLPDDHLRLLDTLKHLKGQFILSYNDAPQVREWYAGFKIKDVERGNSLSKHANSRYHELIITNF